jgi:hypothetical protein
MDETEIFNQEKHNKFHPVKFKIKISYTISVCKIFFTTTLYAYDGLAWGTMHLAAILAFCEYT